MKLLDLFAGIGGFSLAAHWLGWETAAFVERDKFCQQVLKKNFGNVPIYDDITTFDGKPFRGTVDIVSGGFPCQPYSISGKRQGSADERDMLPELLRVVSEAMPRWCVFENVGNFLNDEFASAHDLLRAAMAASGYEVLPIDITSAAYDLPTVERHVWFIASHNSVGRKARSTEQDANKRHVQTQFQRGYSRIAERWHASESRVLRTGQGISLRLDRLRVRTLGNAIPPRVAFEIFRSIEAAETL